MNTHPQGVSRRRRTGEEVTQLVSEFEASGLRAGEYCRRHGLASSTLRRRLQKQRRSLRPTKAGVRLIAVKVNGTLPSLSRAPATALEVILTGGRKIAVVADFDAATFRRLVRVMEDL
jgi:transposase-like protein